MKCGSHHWLSVSIASMAALFLAVSVAAPIGTAAQQVAPDPLVQNLAWRNIGPGNMMGRITAIEALPTDYRHVLVASASGGVFKSLNGGITWDPIFDNSGGAGSIGSVAMFEPDPDIIWVGTGEAANRNSSGWGNGIYKTTDGGQSWQHLGLESTQHIAEIALHPTDPDIAYAASPGHLWGYSGDRGLFKTTDGGATWTKLGTDAPVAVAGLGATGGLPNDERTGATEIIMDPRDPDVLFVGMYHRLRQPATMYSGGPNGGIFKSTDAGASWRRLSNGLAEGESGMIDLSIHLADPDILVAAYEADQRIPYDDSKHASENVPGGGIYISRDAGENWTWLLRTNTRPFYHGQVEIDPNDPDRIFSVSRSFQVTQDGGQAWTGKGGGGGGDDHDLWIAPYDSKIFYTATDQGAHITVDDGQATLSLNNMAIGQYYKIGVDMRDPYWVIGGLQDNAIWIGPSNSREPRGILNMHYTWLGEGDGFASLVDPTDHRVVYGVNHVGFAARINFETREYVYITPTPETVVNFSEYAEAGYNAEKIVYTIDPGEHWFFQERPLRPLMPPHFRFNWNSPLTMSPSNSRVLYFGSNHLFRSVDRGDSWRIISPDLTTNDPELRNPSGQGGLTVEVTGGENHFTIFTVRESPLNPGLIWVGTDDGNVQVTRDGGETWRNVRDNIPGIPSRTWVNRVEPSHHAEGTAYVAFDNHRLDDMKPYVFKTTDFGETFVDISGELPDGHSVYVVLEDPVNPNLLFVGTELGAFATVDGGGSWTKLSAGMPTVAVRDMVIHPRDGDLVAGTHGRSLWILDDLSPLRQFTPEVAASDAHLFESELATNWFSIKLGRKQPDFYFAGQNPPSGAVINFWLKEAPEGDVQLQVAEVLGDRAAEVPLRAGSGFRGRGGSGRREPPGGGGFPGAGGRVAPGVAGPQAGINRVVWNLRFPSTVAERGETRNRLESAIDLISRKGPDPDKLAQLASLRDELGGADDDGTLNSVRNQLATDFNRYAEGRPLFGPQIGESEAAPGVYRVTLTVNGVTHEGSLIVRDDPLKTERW